MNIVQVEPAIFADRVARARGLLRAPLGFGIHPYKPAEYAQMRCFMQEQWPWAGYAIKPDGELTNVFSFAKGRGDAVVQNAIANGAKKLDCYETVANVYARNGFVETGRDTWNPAYAPAGWIEHWFGRPDVVYMVRP